MQVKDLLKSGLAEKNDLLGSAAGIARQDYNLTWPLLHVQPLVITLTFYFNSPPQQMNIFFCLFVAAAAALLTLSCAIVKWPSSAFFTYAFCLSWPSAAILPHSSIFSHFPILLFHFIRPSHSKRLTFHKWAIISLVMDTCATLLSCAAKTKECLIIKL